MRNSIITRALSKLIHIVHDLPLYLCHAWTTGQTLQPSPKYSSTHYTLRTILLNGCTDSHRRAIRRVEAETAFLHLQCSENRAVSSKPDLATVRATQNASLSRISPEVLKSLKRSLYRTRRYMAKQVRNSR